MSIPLLSLDWPAALDEIGPEQDPTILLSGAAQIGRTLFRIMAIRVQPDLRFMPDFQPDAEYDTDALETKLEDLAVIADTDHPGEVELAGGRYVVWMTPTPRPD